MTKDSKFDLVSFFLLFLMLLGLRYTFHWAFGQKHWGSFIVDGVVPSILIAAVMIYVARRRREKQRIQGAN